MSVALVLREKGRFRLEERELRETRPDEALLSIIATGICGSDIHGAAGHTGRRSVGQVMGHETVGRVMAVGSSDNDPLLGVTVAVDPVVSCGSCSPCMSGLHQHCATGWVVGVRPDVDGAFASHIVVPVRNLAPLPPGMTDWHGALVEPLAVGYHAIRRGRTEPSDRVLVLGGGPIGQGLALACRRVGIEALVVSEPDSGRATFIERELGFHTSRPDNLDEAVHETLGGPATLVFDAVGNESSMADALSHSAPHARVVLVGMDAPRLSISAYEISSRERTIIGTICSTREHFRETAEWAGQNASIISRLADLHAPLREAPEVFAKLMAGTLRANKMLLFPEEHK